MIDKKIKRVKIPKNAKAIFCNKKNILLISGIKGEIKMSPCLKIFISQDSVKSLVNITTVPIKSFSRNKIKNLLGIQGELVSSIKKAFLEVSQSVYKRLDLVGVGYRAILSNGDLKIDSSFTLKLGFSHLVYVTLPAGVKIYCKKYNKITIFGGYGDIFQQTIATIRLLKSPEPYKGKGILYQDEKIKLKVGKRV